MPAQQQKQYANVYMNELMNCRIKTNNVEHVQRSADILFKYENQWKHWINNESYWLDIVYRL